ncbi:MAG: c-type cytochrome domain-containing protein [Pirellulales bacterium]
MLAVAAAFPWTVVAAQEPQADRVSYAKTIEPLFRSKCQGCHQPAKPQGKYEMTNFSRLLAAGESGSAAIVPGKPDESYLIDQITVHDGKAEMPKKGQPLSAVEIESIRKWIEQGAVDDRVHGQGVQTFSAEHPPEYVQPPVLTSVAASPNGKWLAVTGFHEVLLLDSETKQLAKRLIGLSERVETVAFSPDSNRLAVTGGSPGRLGEVQIRTSKRASYFLAIKSPTTHFTVERYKRTES